jgi:hypothetical protein
MVSEDKKEDAKPVEVEEFKVARYPPPDPPDSGGSFLRGCGIAVGIAALLFLFVVGACFMSL